MCCCNFRFDPKNSHQRPRVVVLCGSGHQSAIGINCARHLVSRNIYVTILIPDSITVTEEMETEMCLVEFGSCANRTSNCRGRCICPRVFSIFSYSLVIVY